MNNCKTILTIVISIYASLTYAVGIANAEKRVALVIGNETYENTSNLYNPKKDAKDVADALRRLNFKVTEHLDISLDSMRKTVISFGRLARQSDMAVIYFAGHGMEMGGENWLIPTDAQLLSDIDIEDEAIGLSYVMGRLRGARKLSLIILDACRNNPFVSKMKRTSGISRAVSRGFARIEPEENLLVAYAAREGTLADDGKTGQNSPYAAALLRNLETPNIDIRILFGKIRDEVKNKTDKRQVPHTYGSLPGYSIFLNHKDDVVAAFSKPIDSVEVNQRKQTKLETKAWEKIKNTDEPQIIKNFLRQYPDGVVSSFARFKLEQLKLTNKLKLERAELKQQLALLNSSKKAIDSEHIKNNLVDVVAIIRKFLGITSTLQLSGGSICSSAKIHTTDIAQYFKNNSLEYQIVSTKLRKQALKLYDEGRCDIIFVPKNIATITISAFSNPEDHMILPQVISMRPIPKD